jgi:hypothetical protein
VNVPRLRPDESFGRGPDGSASLRFFALATPRGPNGLGFPSVSGPTVLRPESGIYSGPVHVSAAAVAGETVRYTLDGSFPGSASPELGAGVTLRATCSVRARAFAPERLPGPTATAHYLIGESGSLPAVMLAADPAHLFDPDVGIYVKGNGDATGGYPGFPAGPPANYFEDWERQAHAALLEPGRDPVFSQDVGIRIHGKTTRNLAQKSFALFARDRYGAPALEGEVFPGLPERSFSSLLVRNAGSDNTANAGGVQFRDGLAGTLAAGLGLEAAAYRPCVLHLNGAYWGVYELREHQNADRLVAHHGLEPGGIDLLDDYHRLSPWVLEGDADAYDGLIAFLREHALDGSGAAEEVLRRMEVDNFLGYMAAQVYFANQDGPGHNCRFWRPRAAGGRFRWLLYDADHSFGKLTFIPFFGYNPLAYEDNTVAYYREPDGPAWPNPPESTFLFRKILENPGFRDAFGSRVLDLLNTAFHPDTVMAAVESIRDALAPEMPRHFGRWGGSMDSWEKAVDAVREFARRRPDRLREILREEFGWGGPCRLTVCARPEGAGMVRVNALGPFRSAWTGVYLGGLAVALEALPGPGYRFAGWSGTGPEPGDSARVTWIPRGSLDATALFEQTAGLEGGSAGPAGPFVRGPAYPNPFNASVALEFELARGAEVGISVHDNAGRKVRDLPGKAFGAGRHTVNWDGRDSEGRPAPSGIYLLRLESGPSRVTVKIACVR